ncbi:hypothetical protein [Paucibacter sp. B51]|uniref:hypothetical protein n=1 Tax=Paucibacter sp. B51 TaxID=2993315 RepID=UPI0022EBB121|nr:hypothetical protein [Paucibacter sp. B51]
MNQSHTRRSAGHASARQFLQTVLQRYAGLSEYADRGQVQSWRGREPYAIEFRTARNAAGDFRFDFDCPHPYPPLRHHISHHSLGWVADEAYLTLGYPTAEQPLSRRFDDRGYAVAAATGISRGAAHTIAGLLFPETGGLSLLSLQRLRFRGLKQVDGVACYRITGHWDRSRVTLLIGMQDLLLRECKEHRRRRVERRWPCALSTLAGPETFTPPLASAAAAAAVMAPLTTSP